MQGIELLIERVASMNPKRLEEAYQRLTELLDRARLQQSMKVRGKAAFSA